MPQSPGARERAPSRRALMQGAAALALPFPVVTAATAADPAQLIGEQWCALETEQRRLIIAWQDVETWLFKHRDWPKLSEAEQAAVPEAARFEPIDEQLAEIDRVYDRLLPQLKGTPATSRAGVLAKLDALLWFLNVEDHPDARVLLQGCQADIERLWR
ncbi:MAG: hypothetical protein AB1760_18555 [Pseudomonadota bacterium]